MLAFLAGNKKILFPHHTKSQYPRGDVSRALSHKRAPPPPPHNSSIDRIAIRSTSLPRLSPFVEKFPAIPRWPPLVSSSIVRRRTASCCLGQCCVESPGALAAGVPSSDCGSVCFATAGCHTVDCCLRRPRRSLCYPLPTREICSNARGGEGGGLLLVMAQARRRPNEHDFVSGARLELVPKHLFVCCLPVFAGGRTMGEDYCLPSSPGHRLTMARTRRRCTSFVRRLPAPLATCCLFWTKLHKFAVGLMKTPLD